MAGRKFKDSDCMVVEKAYVEGKEERKYLIDGVEKVYPAVPEKYRVSILGGVGYTKENGYENSYLKTVDVPKEKYDMTKIGDKVVATYDYSTDNGKDVLRNFDYELLTKN